MPPTLDQICRSFDSLNDEDRGLAGEVCHRVQKRFEGCRDGPGVLAELVFHDTLHSLGLLEQVTRLLGQSLHRLPRDEARALVLATLTHDVGLIYCDGVERPRALHGRLSERAIEDLLEGLGVDEGTKTIVKAIARNHTKHGTGQLQALPDPARWLAAVFRLADACDMGAHRAPFKEWMQRKGRLSPLSRYHWAIHRTILKIEPDPANRAINVTIALPHRGALDFLAEVPLQDLRTELGLILPVLPRVGIGFGGYQDINHRVVEGAGDSVPELIEAAFWLQAASLYRVTSSSHMVEFYCDTVLTLCGDPPFTLTGEEVRASIEAMTRVACGQPQVAALRRATEAVEAACRRAAGPAWRQRVAGAVRDFKATRSRSLAATAESAARLLAGTSRRAYLLFGYSVPVHLTLQRLALNGVRFSLLTTTTRPLGEQDHLFVLERLHEEGLSTEPITVVPSSLLASFMDVGGIDAVLLGCEAACPDGSVLTSCGARMVAQLAASTRPRVPVFVITDGAKAAAPQPQPPAIPRRELGRFLAQELPAGALGREWHGLDRPCPVSEVVPADLIEVLCDRLWWDTPPSAGPARPSLWEGWTLVFDLDGTLVVGDQVPEGLKRRLADVQKAGGTIGLASGKNAAYLRRFARSRLGLDPGRLIVISENGCLSAWRAGGKGFSLRFPPGRLQAQWLLEARKKTEGRLPGRVSFQNNRVALTIFTDPGHLDEIQAMLGGKPCGVGRFAVELGDGSAISIYRHQDSLDCVPADVDKGRALLEVAGRLGLGLDRVVAVGNGPNDVTMLRAAGHGIAVGGEPEVLSAASACVPDALAAVGLAWEWARAAAGGDVPPAAGACGPGGLPAVTDASLRLPGGEGDHPGKTRGGGGPA